jgi:hypothetical protein
LRQKTTSVDALTDAKSADDTAIGTWVDAADALADAMTTDDKAADALATAPEDKAGSC